MSYIINRISLPDRHAIHNCRITALDKSENKAEEKENHISFLQLLKSTMSAFIGVQSNANRERDFSHGKISHFIGIGLLFALGFILSLVGVVQLVLHLTGN